MKRFCCLFAAALSVSAQDLRGPLSQNLPRWADLGVQVRLRSEGQHGLEFQSGRNDDFLLQRYRVALNIHPTPWLRFFGEGQDARVAGVAHPDAALRDVFDLRQAYIGIGQETGWWDLKAGRQKMLFGSERVIGAAEWGNTARVFDAVRLGVHHGSNRVDMFSSSVVNNDTDHWDHHLQGNNLHGVYASLGSILAGSRVEPYLLLRTNHLADSHTWTAGLRSAGSVRSIWSYEAELLKQKGNVGRSRLEAWALTLQARRKLSLRWQPELLGEFNYASGDRNPDDRVTNTLDQLYPPNHGIYGVANQIGRRNTENVRAGIWMHPWNRLTVKAEGHSFWLASRYDGLYTFNGALTVKPVPGGAASTSVGRELDLIADFKASAHYDVGAQFGHLFPGGFLRSYSAGSGRTFYAVFVDFRLN